MKKLHQRLHARMKKKGWEQHHIDKALKILSSAEAKKHPTIKMLDKAMAWLALVLSLLGNLVISVALIPFLLTMPTVVTMVVTMFFGLCFGFLIDVVLRDIDELSGRHYIIAGAFLPLVAVLNILLASRIMQYVMDKYPFIKPVESYNPLLIVMIYLAAFSVPHFIYKLVLEDIEKLPVTQ
jgi:hypothetical protein